MKLKKKNNKKIHQKSNAKGFFFLKKVRLGARA
jgi:hypothetical protein